VTSPRIALLTALCAVAVACRAGPRSITAAYAWEVMDGATTVSLAAWGKDSGALRMAVEHVRDSMRSSRASPDALRRAWAAERGGVRVHPEWTDVADSYALDRAVPALAAIVDSALFDLGGLFLWIGPPTKRPVGIVDPDNALNVLAHVELQAGALSTVVGEHRSVTALAPGAFTASAWASALFSLGCDGALALAPRLQRGRVSVVCVDSAGVRWTPELQNRVWLPTVRAP
jgi:hypothetical protein